MKNFPNIMRRLICFVALLLLSPTASPERCSNIQVNIQAGNDIEVRIPCVRRDDIIDILATFFGRGDEAAKAKLEKALQSGGQVTLEITSKEK
jgi:hypothetical protein